jgi:hypothetical protein
VLHRAGTIAWFKSGAHGWTGRCTDGLGAVMNWVAPRYNINIQYIFIYIVLFILWQSELCKTQVLVIPKISCIFVHVANTVLLLLHILPNTITTK